MALLAIKGLESTGEPFRQALVQTSLRLGADPNHLAAVIAFETAGTFRSNIRNPTSGAVGLIQFLPSTARTVLGVSTDQLAKLTPVQQMPYVEKYFARVAWGRKLDSIPELYCAVFAPAHLGKPLDAVLYSEGSLAYQQNSALDLNRDGTITKREAAARIEGIYQTAKARGPLSPKEDSSLPFLLGMQLIRMAMRY